LKIVIAEIKKQLRKLENSGEKAVIIDAPTLIESGLHNDCNTVISVISPKEQRIERISLRDGITHNRAQERVKAQKEDQFYISHSDYVLTNDTDKESFLQKIKELGVTLGLTDFTQK
jgi:dephospho-CoA kinase